MLLVQICSSRYWVSNRCPFCASGFELEKQTNSTSCASRAFKGQQHTQLLANHSVHDILWKRLCQLVPSCLAAAIIILLHGKIYASSSSLVSFVYFSTRSSQQFDVRVQCLFFFFLLAPFLFTISSDKRRRRIDFTIQFISHGHLTLFFHFITYFLPVCFVITSSSSSYVVGSVFVWLPPPKISANLFYSGSHTKKNHFHFATTSSAHFDPQIH